MLVAITISLYKGKKCYSANILEENHSTKTVLNTKFLDKMSFRRKFSVFVLVIILTFNSFDIIESATEHCDETNMIESDDIDHQLIGLAQDDPLVIDALKNYYLDKPNSFPRNLDGPLTPFKLQVSQRPWCFVLPPSSTAARLHDRCLGLFYRPDRPLHNLTASKSANGQFLCRATNFGAPKS